MEQSTARLRQEREQQNTLLRSLPNQKDEAAQAIRRRITQLDRQIEAAEAPAAEKSGPNWMAIGLAATALIVVLAFLAGYLGGQAMG